MMKKNKNKEKKQISNNNNNILTRTRKIKKYGWKPDLPDARDHIYNIQASLSLLPLPPKVDLRKQCPATVYDQGNLGSCTANAIVAALEFDMIKQQQPNIYTPSRLFVYYNERVMENSVNEDAGAEIRDGIRSVAKLGDCPESQWPYKISQFTIKPAKTCYTNAKMHQALSYQRIAVRSLNNLKRVLASGYPFTFGFTVYESFESPEVDKTGIVPMPELNKEQVLGGHAVLCVGYDDTQKRFIVRNSWGNEWGDKGYFTMPYEYLTDENLSDDFWVIKLVE